MIRYIYYIALALLVFLFMYTGLSKLLTFSSFYADMRRQMLPKGVVPVLAYSLPVIEVVTALLLAYPRTQYWGLVSALLLMTAFTLYAGLVVVGAFSKTPCSCGGMLKHLSWKQHLLFNVFFLLASILALKLLTRVKQGMPKTWNRVGTTKNLSG